MLLDDQADHRGLLLILLPYYTLLYSITNDTGTIYIYIYIYTYINILMIFIIMCVYIYIYIYNYDYINTSGRPHAPRGGEEGRPRRSGLPLHPELRHSCHILPFRPIL